MHAATVSSVLGARAWTRTSADPHIQRLGRGAGHYADNYQQYLAKNPFGYRCHANTGVTFPETA
jgi:peptide-methionine (S)-S-oxide reductase